MWKYVMLDFFPILMEIYDMRNNVRLDVSTTLMEAYVNLWKVYRVFVL